MATYPKFVKFSKEDIPAAGANLRLIVNGQGVFIFENPQNTDPCVFSFYDAAQKNGLKVTFTQGAINVSRISDNEALQDHTNTQGLVPLVGAFYWFSLDSQNQKLSAGIGEARIETQTYSFTFPSDNKEVWTNNKLFLESLTHIEIGAIVPMRMLRDPITRKVPLLVKNTDELTMLDIAKQRYMPRANLSASAEKLYKCIAGRNFVLDTDDFPEFSKAIEYSLKTLGGWCNTRIKQKSEEFTPGHPNLAETYLRITLSENNGESPGIPYVMEIWPVGHYSPIHNHAGSEAVIRVLHGQLDVSMYPFLCGQKDGIAPFAIPTIVKDDITWISETLNQTHQLHNPSTNSQTCITIQCYMYDSTNLTHYDYFDYIDEDGNIKQYTPDSDMDFVLFKETMRQEWNAASAVHGHLRSGFTGPSGPSGPTGVTGSSSPTGSSGPTGACGVTGASGATGFTGSSGPSGVTGPSSATGSSGPSGVTGNTGSSGPSGATGPSSAAGSFGTTGAAEVKRRNVLSCFCVYD